jgi:hypothetical protein
MSVPTRLFAAVFPVETFDRKLHNSSTLSFRDSQRNIRTSHPMVGGEV